MNEGLALSLLSDLMGWSDEKARDEFQWLRLMSRLKYDGYRDFSAGMRFVESFANWMQQFSSKEDRNAAYRFVRERLVYIGEAEMGHLVELLYPNHVRPRLAESVARSLGLPAYRVRMEPHARATFELLRRKTLFLGLSDGARLDLFRRSNTQIITNEQVVWGTQIGRDKWEDLLDNLRADLDDKTARFSNVYLVDDFAGSGLTLIRKKNGSWKGKLRKFYKSAEELLRTCFEDDWSISVHHHVATNEASLAMVEREQRARAELGQEGWLPKVDFSFGLVLPETLPITREADEDFWDLTERYYDTGLENRHTKVGSSHMRRGFAECGLPLVLEHNTPNNSVSLIWAETDGTMGHPMRPLFRRRDRHSDD